MIRTFLTLLALILVTALAPAVPTSAIAQSGPQLPEASPTAKVMQRVGLTNVTVTYSSPAKRNRKIFGQLVGYGKLWRTGANQATQIEFTTDVIFGGQQVPAGRYAVFTIPRTKGWTVILNSDTTLWGTGRYDKKKDVVRVTTKKPALVPRRERMTFIFSDTTQNSTRLDLEWDRYRISVPIMVPTAKLAAANIKQTIDGAWRPHMMSARYLLENNGDLSTALGYIETSVRLRSVWYNNWIHARILEKMGETAKARTAVQTALKLGDDSGGFKFYQPQMKEALARLK